MPSPDIKRKLAAVFSADAKEYSRLMHEDEAATVQTLTQYREIMTTLILQHRGRLVDSPGDNLLADFPSVVDAVQGAVAIQKELKVRNARLRASRRMEFRIGINLGDVIDEGDRIYGDGVNIAARLESLAEPGGICISRTAYDQIEDKLPLGYEYLGEQNVKNIVKPIHAYKVLLGPEAAGHTSDAREGSRRKLPNQMGAAKRVGQIRKRAAEFRKSDPSQRNLSKEDNAIPKDRLSPLAFRKKLMAYSGVVGVLLIINLLSWQGRVWFHWPAASLGLILFLGWLHTRKWDRATYENRSRYRFYKHLGTYLAVIGFLLIVNIFTWAGHIWFHWPALSWGFLLFLHWVRISDSFT